VAQTHCSLCSDTALETKDGPSAQKPSLQDLDIRILSLVDLINLDLQQLDCPCQHIIVSHHFVILVTRVSSGHSVSLEKPRDVLLLVREKVKCEKLSMFREFLGPDRDIFLIFDACGRAME
jgi:hypothetical protein